MPPRFPKAASGPVEEHVMTTDDIVDIVGDDALDTRDEIEIIFGNFTEVGGLTPCSQLQALTMMKTSLLQISNLQPVSMTLERLCLCDQSITRMENLQLPVLRELLLHQNSISRIEGLDGMPHLPTHLSQALPAD